MRSDTTIDRFRGAVLRNPANAALLERLPGLALPDCWLVAGCLFQTFWNVESGRPPAENISDYDVFYFDDGDTSYDAEDRIIRRVEAACADLGVKIEVKNQARVHLWYAKRFGPGYPKLENSKDGIRRFLISGTCIGIGASSANRGEFYAPNGLEDVDAGILRPNRLNLPAKRFDEKAASYKARWPHLTTQPE